MRALVRLGRAGVVALAIMLVLSALTYGGMHGRGDVVAVIVAELVVVGALLAVVRSWRVRRAA